MPSSTVNICVVTLVLLSLQQICDSRPQTRSKRGLVKHYFEPDVLVFSPEEFEKGEDGKFYLKNSSRKLDSLVEYAVEDKDNVFPQDVKNGDVETLGEPPIAVEAAKRDILAEEVGEISKADEAVQKPLPPTEVQVKTKKEDLSKPDITREEKLKKIEKAPFAPDPKMVAPEKPDSKDEISISKSDLPPVDVDEKADEKISIGQTPHFYPRIIPAPGDIKLPFLIPVRKVSYGAVSVIPLPPADASDRLPFAFEDDIVGEGPHETESEEISKSVAVEKKDEDIGYNPLMRLPLPFLPFRTFLDDVKENKQDVEKQSKVVDILGKKFLMQSKVMKQPMGDNTNMYVRFMSVKPMEDFKPNEPVEKAAEVEESVIEKVKPDIPIEIELKREVKPNIPIEIELKREVKPNIPIEIELKREVKPNIPIDIELKREGKPDIPVEIELKREAVVKDVEVLKEGKSLKEPEAEILKAEETEVRMKIDDKYPRDVILKSKGDSGLKENPTDTGTKDAVFVDIKSLKAEGSAIASEVPVIRNKEIGVVEVKEKVEDEIFESSEELSSKTNLKSLKGDIGKREEIIEEKEIFSKDDSMTAEATEVLKKEEATKKATDLDFKKSIYLSEKNKKLKSAEETEEEKKPKKNPKKKKCKCEESDSDEDEE